MCFRCANWLAVSNEQFSTDAVIGPQALWPALRRVRLPYGLYCDGSAGPMACIAICESKQGMMTCDWLLWICVNTNREQHTRSRRRN